jgi:hypothetical protein
LRADTVTAGGTLTETGDLADEVTTLTAQVTAGATTAFDKAEALRRWFTDPANGFTYSLNVPPGDSGDTLVDFLNNRTGFCEQYASAMAIMLRAAGVPARVAVGFTQGVQDPDGSYTISSNDAHAWVEVLFDKAGWVRFDPTPLGGGQGGEQGFVDGAPTTEAAPSTSAAATSGRAPSGGLNPDGEDIGGASAGSTAAAPLGADQPRVSTTVWWLLTIALLLAAAAAGPTVVRKRRRMRRRSLAEAGGPAAAAAVWSEVEDLAVDHGIGLNPAESARAVANRLARATHLPDADRATLRRLVMQVESGWYAQPAAPTAGPTLSSTPPPTGGQRAGDARRDATPTAGTLADMSQPTPQPAGHDTATMTGTRPAGSESLWPAATAIGEALDRNAPLSLIDRLVPRSVRPAWWRE